MRNRFTTVLLGLFLAISIFAAPKKATDFKKTIINQFAKQVSSSAQEKIYVQTDKPYYSAGEEIWFKCYLVNATTFEPNALSKFVYVELIDKRDSVLCRVKLKADSLGFAGHIKLKPETPMGQYVLRSYTYWMQNTGKDFFYSKTVLIGNPIDDQVSTQITYGNPVDGKIPVTIAFTDAVHNPIAGKEIEIIQNWKSAPNKKLNAKTSKDGKIGWQLQIDAKDDSKKYIGISLPDVKFKTNLFLPEFSTDFDMQFFPESGVMLNNSFQPIAFKAIGKNGLSVDVTGKVFTNKNEELCDFASFHKGMGKFSILVQPNESFYAIVKTSYGTEKRFELPKSQEDGVALHLLYKRGKILYEVVNQTKIADKSLYLLLHSRGKVIGIQNMNKMNGQIPDSLLPAGIVSFSVIDSLGNTFCERLSFIHNFNFPIFSVQSDKPAYEKREAANLIINVQSLLKKPVTGSYSISITDSHTVKQDSLGGNIFSNLLLTSDIKGYVENPGEYFLDNKITTYEKIDLLMLTQGWRRFKTADVVKATYNQPKYFMEVGQALTGKVMSIFKNPSKKCQIIMLSPYKNVFRTTVTDSLGRYLIDGIEFPDSTAFVIKAKRQKSITDVEITPDNDDFPESSSFIPTPLKVNIAPEQDEYFKLSKEKYYYEGGMRVINLSEITISAKRETYEKYDFYSGLADTELKSDQIERFPHTNIFDLLATIPGLQVAQDHVSIRGSQNNPLFLVDDVEMLDIQDISYITSDDIKNIQVFRGVNASIFGGRGGDGVIAITLKEGVKIKYPTPISLANISPLGYQKPSQFYVPKYEVDSVLKKQDPDLRTTIYWNPKLAADINGNINVKFYTADKTNNYNIEVEGITNAGELCRYVGVLRREDK